MAIREIVTFPDDRLRNPTTPVTEFNDELRELIEDMFETMYVDNGIGLAAPQIGISKKIVVIDIPDEDENERIIAHNQLVLINPEITEKKGTVTYKEGCLSVPEIYEEVERAEVISLKAQNEFGEPIEFKDVTGLLAICMQHELDHLNGRLFVDYLSTYKRERVTKAMLKLKKEEAKKKKLEAANARKMAHIRKENIARTNQPQTEPTAQD